MNSVYYIKCIPILIPEGEVKQPLLGPFGHLERAVELCRLYNEKELRDRQNVFLHGTHTYRLQNYVVDNHRVNSVPHPSNDWRDWFRCVALIPNGVGRWESVQVQSTLNYVVKINLIHITRVQPIKIVHAGKLDLTKEEKVIIMNALPYPIRPFRKWVVQEAAIDMSPEGYPLDETTLGNLTENE